MVNVEEERVSSGLKNISRDSGHFYEGMVEYYKEYRKKRPNKENLEEKRDKIIDELERYILMLEDD